MLILAIDPGIENYGWAVIHNLRESYDIINSGRGKAHREQSPGERVVDIGCQIAILAQDNKVERIIVEDWMGKERTRPAPSVKMLKLEIPYRISELLDMRDKVIFVNTGQIKKALTDLPWGSKEAAWDALVKAGVIHFDDPRLNKMNLHINQHELDAIACGYAWLKFLRGSGGAIAGPGVGPLPPQATDTVESSEQYIDGTADWRYPSLG